MLTCSGRMGGSRVTLPLAEPGLVTALSSPHAAWNRVNRGATSHQHSTIPLTFGWTS